MIILLTLRFNRVNIYLSLKQRGGRQMKVTLKQLRGLRELTRQEAADMIGVSLSTWDNWENMRTFPDAPKINKITEVFDIDYDDIIFFEVKHGLTVRNKQKA